VLRSGSGEGGEDRREVSTQCDRSNIWGMGKLPYLLSKLDIEAAVGLDEVGNAVGSPLMKVLDELRLSWAEVPFDYHDKNLDQLPSSLNTHAAMW
jgi:hypothetical protein